MNVALWPAVSTQGRSTKAELAYVPAQSWVWVRNERHPVYVTKTRPVGVWGPDGMERAVHKLEVPPVQQGSHHRHRILPQDPTHHPIILDRQGAPLDPIHHPRILDRQGAPLAVAPAQNQPGHVDVGSGRTRDSAATTSRTVTPLPAQKHDTLIPTIQHSLCSWASPGRISAQHVPNCTCHLIIPLRARISRPRHLAYKQVQLRTHPPRVAMKRMHTV